MTPAGGSIASISHNPYRPPAATGARPIRVLIVDDSAVVRAVLARMLSREAGFEVIGQASDAGGALAILRNRTADVVLLDVQMPGQCGLSALPQIVAQGRGARVVIVSSFCEEGAVQTMAALAAGAADAILKPGAAQLGQRFGELLTGRLKRLVLGEPGEGAVIHRLRPPPSPPKQAALPPRRGAVGCIAIGASTGGIHALAGFFAGLPAGLTTPILVTQHLPAQFMPFFAQQIAAMAGRAAAVAEHGMVVKPGAILIAPGDGHLTLLRTGGTVRVCIDRTPATSRCMPSVDPMLRSVAEVYGAAGVAVILSGMGRDGAEGAEVMVLAGAEVLAQDQASSVVWGMPGTVARRGLAAEVLAPAGLAEHLSRRIEGRTAAWR